MSDDRWPLRYRIGKKVHHVVNRLHRATGQGRATGWLNDKAAALWVNWWIQQRVRSMAEDV